MSEAKPDKYDNIRSHCRLLTHWSIQLMLVVKKRIICPLLKWHTDDIYTLVFRHLMDNWM